MSDNTLWCVHVIGPDDLYAAASLRAAVIHAHALNVAIQARMPAEAETDENYVMCWANVAEWPWSPEGHAEDLERWRQEEVRRRAALAESEGGRDG